MIPTRNMKRGDRRARQNKYSGRRMLRQSMLIAHPPPIHPQIIHHQRMRFVSNAAVFKNITFQNLLDSIGVSVTAILGYQLFDEVRLGSVEVWSLPALGASNLVTVQFSGATVGSLGDGAVHSDNSMGIEPAHVLARPNSSSQSAQWQLSAAANAFALTCPAGSVVDVTCSFRMLTTQAPVALQNAYVAATIGDVYYRGLDGLAVAATALPAQAPSVN
jgi:hypothetical protein